MRLPVILYYIEDFSVKEIAQILEISEGAVQKRHSACILEKVYRIMDTECSGICWNISLPGRERN